MRLSIFTTVTNPERRGDNWEDALRCYSDLADEVIIINGGRDIGIPALNNLNIIKHKWPNEFRWPFIGQQFQRGYEAATGDWVLHCDIDFLFHEASFKRIREMLEMHPESPGMSFYKWQFILPDRYNLKSRLVIAVNKRKYGARIRFNSGGDLCQPSLDGEEIRPDFVPEIKIPLYNYEKINKTAPQVTDDVGRMARAWTSHFGDYRLGRDNESAFDEWIIMMRGRFQKPQEQMPLDKHPIYIQETIKRLTPEQWGFNGFGLLEDNKYIKDIYA